MQPLLILGLTALAVAIPGLAQNSNPGFHGLSQVLYEYTSAFANNGSGFEGLGDNTVWWNVSCAVALILGRFIPILAPLAVAAYLAGKRVAPDHLGQPGGGNADVRAADPGRDRDVRAAQLLPGAGARTVRRVPVAGRLIDREKRMKHERKQLKLLDAHTLDPFGG